MKMLKIVGEMLKSCFGPNAKLDFGNQIGHLFFECEFEGPFSSKILLYLVLKQEVNYCIDLQDFYIGEEGQSIGHYLLYSEDFLNYIGNGLTQIKTPADVFTMLCQYNRVALELGYIFQLKVIEPPRLFPFSTSMY